MIIIIITSIISSRRVIIIIVIIISVVIVIMNCSIVNIITTITLIIIIIIIISIFVISSRSANLCYSVTSLGMAGDCAGLGKINRIPLPFAQSAGVCKHERARLLHGQRKLGSYRWLSRN